MKGALPLIIYKRDDIMNVQDRKNSGVSQEDHETADNSVTPSKTLDTLNSVELSE